VAIFTFSRYLHFFGRRPCMQIYGKGRCERDWRVVDVFATAVYDLESRWPLCAGTCVTWGATAITVGWDFALAVLREQAASPASREKPVEVGGGRIRDWRRVASGAAPMASASEILAHECGHTWQARRLSILYLPLVGCVTLFREGPHFWNYFENQASEIGQFGGIVKGTVASELMNSLRVEASILL
jgi:hypothetical protein